MILFKKIFKILFKIPDPFYFYDDFLKRPGIFLTLSILLRYLKNNKKLHIILILDLFKKIYSLLILILFFPIYLILFIYLKKKKLVLISINSWQIGALIQQLDSIIKNDKKKRYFLICPNFLIEFKSFPNIYNKKNLKYSNNFILYLFVYPFLVFKEFSGDAFDYEVLNIKSKFNKIHSNTEYKYHFNKLLDKSNNNLNFNDEKLITIHFKDETFIKSHSNRNSNYKLYVKVIKSFIRKKYTVVRFIHLKSKKKILKNKNYHELIVANETDKIRQFNLIKKSKLFICTQSGPSSYSLILDTPFLQVNSYPINVAFVSKPKDYLIFKLIKKKGKYINLKNMIKKNFHLNFDNYTIYNKSYNLVDNLSSDILKAANDSINKSKSYYFSKILKKNKIKIPGIYSMSKIPNSFYKKIIKLRLIK